MRIRLRSRCPHLLLDYTIKCLTIVLVGVKLCQRHVCTLLCVLIILLFIWWTAGRGDRCYGSELVEHVCAEYRDKKVAGDFCDILCNERLVEIASCTSNSKFLQIFQNDDMVFTVPNEPLKTWGLDRIDEGTKLKHFINSLEKYILTEMGSIQSSRVIDRLVGDFDLNKDGYLNLGEAQSMWRLVKQPFFLSFYIFQDSSAVPHLNGSCGGISIWHRPQMVTGDNLFQVDRPWLLGLFSRHPHRWTLPAWHKRAKVVLSLLEFVDEMYEKLGVRYHLCNISGMTLFHLQNYEVTISEDTLLLSSRQITNKLSNITCHSSSDCLLTPQCQTLCDAATGRCTGALVRPTAAYVCDMMEDYLLFDTPRTLKSTLSRLIHRCQNMSMQQPKLDLLHSVVVIDMKTVLWNAIQFSR